MAFVCGVVQYVYDINNVGRLLLYSLHSSTRRCLTVSHSWTVTARRMQTTDDAELALIALTPSARRGSCCIRRAVTDIGGRLPLDIHQFIQCTKIERGLAAAWQHCGHRVVRALQSSVSIAASLAQTCVQTRESVAVSAASSFVPVTSGALNPSRARSIDRNNLPGEVYPAAVRRCSSENQTLASCELPQQQLQTVRQITWRGLGGSPTGARAFAATAAGHQFFAVTGHGLMPDSGVQLASHLAVYSRMCSKVSRLGARIYPDQDAATLMAIYCH
jgi:hypothetical protein